MTPVGFSKISDTEVKAVKVKCITNYHDLQLKKDIITGQELEVTQDRATVLINAKVAEAIVEPTTPEVVTKPAKKAKKVVVNE